MKNSRVNRKNYKQRVGRRNGPQGVSNIPRNYLSTHVAGVAPHIRRTLSWSYNYGISLVNNAVFTEYVTIVLNSPYDPDAALGGLSATGFAKYMALYSKCFTHSAKVTTKYALSGASYGGVSPAVAILGQTITTFSASLLSTVAAINAGLCDYNIHNQSLDQGTLHSAVDIARFVDKPNILDDPEFFCTSSANPTQIVVLHLWAVVPSNLFTCNVNYVINVDFDCTFTDPIPFT